MKPDTEAEPKLMDRNSLRRLCSQFLTQFLDNGVQFLGVLDMRTNFYTTYRALIRNGDP